MFLSSLAGFGKRVQQMDLLESLGKKYKQNLILKKAGLIGGKFTFRE